MRKLPLLQNYIFIFLLFAALPKIPSFSFMPVSLINLPCPIPKSFHSSSISCPQLQALLSSTGPFHEGDVPHRAHPGALPCTVRDEKLADPSWNHIMLGLALHIHWCKSGIRGPLSCKMHHSQQALVSNYSSVCLQAVVSGVYLTFCDTLEVKSSQEC